MRPIRFSTGWNTTYFVVVDPIHKSIVGNNKKEKKVRGYSRKLKGATLGQVASKKDLEIAQKWEQRPKIKIGAKKQCRAQKLREDYNRIWNIEGKKDGVFGSNKHSSKTNKKTKQFWNRPSSMAYGVYIDLRGW